MAELETFGRQAPYAPGRWTTDHPRQKVLVWKAIMSDLYGSDLPVTLVSASVRKDEPELVEPEAQLPRATSVEPSADALAWPPTAQAVDKRPEQRAQDLG